MLPIVMIFERHWDETPKQLVQELIPQLSFEGYNTLCFEAGSERSEQDMLLSLKELVKTTTNLHTRALDYLEHAQVQIKGRLSDLSYEKLCDLMEQHVASKYYRELTEKIKNLPAILQLERMLEMAAEHSFSLKGVDSGKDLDEISSSKSFRERGIKVHLNEASRIQRLAEELFRLHSEQKGIIHIGGGVHSKRLVAKLMEKGLKESDIICYFPHSSKFFSSTETDFEVIKEDTLEGSLHCLKDEKEIKSFSQKIITEIRLKNRHYQKEIVGGTYQSRFLTDFFQVEFKAFLKPGYHVDALLLKNSAEDIEGIIQKQHEKNIQTESVFLKDEEYLLIRNVNTKAVYENIQKLQKIAI